MSAGSDIAAEIRAGLVEAGEQTGDGINYCVIRRNDPAAVVASDPVEAELITTIEPLLFELVIVETKNMEKDRNGSLTGVVQRTLLIDATGVTPLKSDTIAIRVRAADVTSDTKFEEIMAVDSITAGGIALMHKVMLKD